MIPSESSSWVVPVIIEVIPKFSTNSTFESNVLVNFFRIKTLTHAALGSSWIFLFYFTNFICTATQSNNFSYLTQTRSIDRDPSSKNRKMHFVTEPIE